MDPIDLLVPYKTPRGITRWREPRRGDRQHYHSPASPPMTRQRRADARPFWVRFAENLARTPDLPYRPRRVLGTCCEECGCLLHRSDKSCIGCLARRYA